MQQSSEHKARPKTVRALAIAAALLCVTALSQPNLAYAGPHGGGGGGGFHGGGGGGFHGGGFHGGGFHGGGFGGFHGGGFGGFHSRFAGMHNGFGERHEGFRDRRHGFIGGLGFGYYGYPYGWDYSPDDGYYDYSQPYSSQIWYYCSDPAGYYPYVTQCNTGWQTVPAS
ncbi:MAG: hypothetical protein ACJ8AH_18540 [Stellaceae bacterium]